MNLSLETSLRLSQTLSPQMIQSLKLLQYSNLQLEQVLRKELQENPILEETASEDQQTEDNVDATDAGDAAGPESAVEPESAAASDDGESEPDYAPPAPVTEGPAEAPAGEPSPADTGNESAPEVDWGESYNDGFDLGYRRTDEERVDEIYEKIPINTLTLEEHLVKQLHEKKLSPGQIEIGEFLIGNIDDKGFLVVDPASVAEKFAVTTADVNEIRHLIQHFDPLGVASLGLQETLLVQLRARGQAGSLMTRILEQHFELLKKYNIQEIARKTGLPVAEIQQAVREIGKLEPSPGTLYGGGRPQTITPELLVTKLENGEFAVTLNDGNVPSIRVSRAYIDLLRKERKRSPDVKKYLSEKVNAANWLIRAIEQRKVTMIKVMTAIVERQRTWFEKGPPHLRPLILQEIADIIHMHISTVCRVTNDKYVQTPYGIFELKYFFSSAVDQEDGSEVSTSRAKDLLKDLVGQEDKKRPLSDQRLTELLGEKAIQVARRTVAKYREQLSILPARLRKEF
ncbi:MAG: RNA polymerase factor sigma-54 [Fibrobacterota bacterium]